MKNTLMTGVKKGGIESMMCDAREDLEDLAINYSVPTGAPKKKNKKNAEIDRLKIAPSVWDPRFIGVWVCDVGGPVPLETLTVSDKNGRLLVKLKARVGIFEKVTNVKTSGVCLSFDVREGTENETEFGLSISEDGQMLSGSWTAVENGCGVRGSRTFVRKVGA